MYRLKCSERYRFWLPRFDNPWENLRMSWKVFGAMDAMPYDASVESGALSGTEFYHKAIEDGFVSDKYNPIYRKSFILLRAHILTFYFFWRYSTISRRKSFSSLPKNDLYGDSTRKNMTRFGEACIATVNMFGVPKSCRLLRSVVNCLRSLLYKSSNALRIKWNDCTKLSNS